MLQAVTSGITSVISWIGSVIEALVGTEGALAPLLPLFAIGIAVSAVLLGRLLIAQVKPLKFGGTLSETIPSQAFGKV